MQSKSPAPPSAEALNPKAARRTAVMINFILILCVSDAELVKVSYEECSERSEGWKESTDMQSLSLRDARSKSASMHK